MPQPAPPVEAVIDHRLPGRLAPLDQAEKVARLAPGGFESMKTRKLAFL